MRYDRFKYLFPPRPEVKTAPTELDKFDTGEYIAQPKYNGSCTTVFTNGTDLRIFNRHKEELKRVGPAIEFKKMAKTPNWFVFCGEYLNKGKIGETGEKEKDKFVLWDVLVWDGHYLVGTPLLDRLELMEREFPCIRMTVKDQLETYEHLCWTDLAGIYKAPTYLNGFSDLYLDIVKTDLYEGLVLKKLSSRLAFGFQALNNQDWQIKCRKETKIYTF